MKMSHITRWRQSLAHPWLTSRIFPPPSLPLPSSPQEEETELVELRDPAEQGELCEDTEPYRTAPEEPLWQTVLGLLILAVLFLLALLIF